MRIFERSEETPREPISQRAYVLATAMMAILLFVIGSGMAAVYVSTRFVWQSDEERQAANMERFPCASPECVAQEVFNPGYRNNEAHLLLCELEMQVQELKLHLKAPVSRETPP